MSYNQLKETGLVPYIFSGTTNDRFKPQIGKECLVFKNKHDNVHIVFEDYMITTSPVVKTFTEEDGSRCLRTSNSLYRFCEKA